MFTVHVEVGVDEVNVTIDGSSLDGKIVEVCVNGLGGRDAVDWRKPHNDHVHQGPVLYPVEPLKNSKKF